MKIESIIHNSDNFVFIAKPLHDNQRQYQMKKQEKAFRKLKKKFTKKPVLAILKLDKENENRS